MKLDLVIDWTSGETWLRGRDGRRYSDEELDAALRGAERGEPEAKATLANLDRSEPGDPPWDAAISDEEFVRRVLDDCPECRAAAARGEPMLTISGDELMRRYGTMPAVRARRPSWWERKVRRSRGRR